MSESPDNWRKRMPWKNGDTPELIRLILEYAYAPFMAALVALMRGAYAGSGFVKTILEAFIIGSLTLAFVPLLRYFEMPEDLSVFAGSAMAFMGVDWIRMKIDKASRIIIDKWDKRP